MSYVNEDPPSAPKPFVVARVKHLLGGWAAVEVLDADGGVFYGANSSGAQPAVDAVVELIRSQSVREDPCKPVHALEAPGSDVRNDPYRQAMPPRKAD
jgi:hypothetical protein